MRFLNSLKEWVKSLSAPRFKIGDEVYMIKTDFPDIMSTKVITAVGQTEYQYKYKFYPPGDVSPRILDRVNTTTINYIDSCYNLRPQGVVAKKSVNYNA